MWRRRSRRLIENGNKLTVRNRSRIKFNSIRVCRCSSVPFSFALWWTGWLLVLRYYEPANLCIFLFIQSASLIVPRYERWRPRWGEPNNGGEQQQQRNLKLAKSSWDWDELKVDDDDNNNNAAYFGAYRGLWRAIGRRGGWMVAVSKALHTVW